MNIPTAEEFCKPYTRLRSAMAIHDLTECMIEFTKLHLESQKKEILEKVTSSYGGDYFEDSIINAYPLTNLTVGCMRRFACRNFQIYHNC